ncbi:MAG TPA: VWA domain-containing protein [Nitrospiraceae bacterium]|nr:VWA domain-containing protein [Nitrospiraceae bacterium]
MGPDNHSDKLIDRLVGLLDYAMASDLTRDLLRAANGAHGRSAIMALLDELEDLSPKVLEFAIEALPELRRRGALPVVIPWLDLGVALAGSSGAAAMKYFKESPLVLSLLVEGSRSPVLAVALELAESDPNVALDFFRKAPELLAILPASDLTAWTEVGVELARVDYVLGIEFFRQSPSVARVIPLGLLRDWVKLGAKLITQNSLGKPDYVGTLEFFRTSPLLFEEIEGTGTKKGMIDVGTTLADRNPALAISFLAECPSILRSMPSDEWKIRVLQYGVFIAERDSESALAYLRRCPEIIAWLGSTPEARPRFEEWFKGGMDVLAYSAEGARAYFAVETQKALASIEQALSGVPLRRIARTLKVFAQGLCGVDVVIHSLPENSAESGDRASRARVEADGRTIALPALLRRFPTREENARLYTVMVAHEAGHLEFGTYDLSLSEVEDVIGEVRRRYHREPSLPLRTLGDLFALYPQPGLIRDLWTLLEDARVEHRLQHEYPGLRHDLAMLARDAVNTRSLLHGLSAREMVVDCLLMLSTTDPATARIPDGIAPIVEQAWALGQTLLTPTTTPADAVRMSDRLYVLLDEMMATVDETTEFADAAPQSDIGPGPTASETTSGVYRPVTNWAYRGEMDPDLVQDQDQSPNADDNGDDAPTATPPAVSAESGSLWNATSGAPSSGNPSRTSDQRGARPTGEHFGHGNAFPSSIEDLLAVGRELHERRPASVDAGPAFLYDEWDGRIRDYRAHWCRVTERVAHEGNRQFAEAVLATHGPAVRLLRRYFESIRSPARRRVFCQTDGEDIDLDAAIGRSVDRVAGVEPSDRVYIRRDKRDRDVAVAFLVDLSGSTSRQIDPSGRRVIDVEKEGLLLLAEALDAVGDQYAIYGYSGQGRHQVDFVVIKDFDEPSHCVLSRVGGIVPLHQNRDGAAVRHAGQKLLMREAQARLLVLLSDGKPLDESYADEYALEDTKAALREIQRRGIHPFCVTVDGNPDDYLKRMYGEVQFVVIDKVESLPERLPNMYRRLTA